MYKIDSYKPFPSELRGDEGGAFYETLLQDKTTSKYVIIWPQKFMTQRDKELLSDGKISLEEIYPEIALLHREVNENSHWLYTLDTFLVKREFHQNQTMFSDKRTNFHRWVFDDFNELMNFCSKEFGIGVQDFRKSWETNYPQS